MKGATALAFRENAPEVSTLPKVVSFIWLERKEADVTATVLRSVLPT